MGWLISVSAGLAFLFPLKYIREKLFAKDSCFYSLMSFFNLAFVMYIYQPSLGYKPGLLVYFIIAQALGLALVKLVDLGGTLTFKTNLIYFFMIVMSLAWFTSLNPGWYSVHDWKYYNFIFFIAVVLVFYLGVRKNAQMGLPEKSHLNILGWNVRKNSISYFFAFSMIAFSINTLFNYDPFHYSFFLGPVADLVGGKSLLVNINAQYGVLIFYFLRFFFYFMPLGFVSFSAVLAFLTGVQYLLFFFIVRKLFKSEILSFFSLIVLLLINHFAQFNDGILFPSVGPLRFGHIYVLMALILLRNQNPQKRNRFYLLESLVVGISFFWSFEVCFYIVFSYFCLLLFESISVGKGFKFDLPLFLKRQFWIMGCILGIGLLIYLDVFRRTFEWPHWSYYFDFVSNYKNGFGMLELPAIGYWWIFVATLYFSLFAVIGISAGKNKTLPQNLNAIFLLTIYGILQFTYYFGRAHSNNLFHLSMPVILLVIFWLYFSRYDDPSSVPGTVKKLGYGISVLLIAFYLQKTTDFAIQKINKQPQSIVVMLNRILNLPNVFHSLDANIQQVTQLMMKYSGYSKSLVYFFGETGLSVEMSSGIVNVYPFSDTIQPTVSDGAMERIKAFKPELKIGDCIYTTNPNDFEKVLFDKLASRFDLKLMETQNSVSVYKIMGERKSS
jgi:hypothetical protein